MKVINFESFKNGKSCDKEPVNNRTFTTGGGGERGGTLKRIQISDSQQPETE